MNLKSCLYLTSAFGAGFFCWAVFAVGDAFGADPHSAYGQGHGEAHGGSSAGLPQLDTTTFPSQLFWLAVSFALLYVIFSKKSLPEISNVLENRRQHIDSDLEQAEKLRREADASQATYESGLRQARENAQKSVQDINDRIKQRAEQQNETFRARADKDIEALEKSLTKAKEAAMDDMNVIAAEVASEAARKIVGIKPDIEQAKTVVRALNGEAKAKAA